jgi:hypothetical protein
MKKQYEAPELTVIGEADVVIMGASIGTSEGGLYAASDFEFEDDWALI